MQTIGTRAQVWHGTATKTSGGLTKRNLIKNKHGSIVSKKNTLLEKKPLNVFENLDMLRKKVNLNYFTNNMQN
jgi:hypothetical protein